MRSNRVYNTYSEVRRLFEWTGSEEYQFNSVNSEYVKKNGVESLGILLARQKTISLHMVNKTMLNSCYIGECCIYLLASQSNISLHRVNNSDVNK